MKIITACARPSRRTARGAIALQSPKNITVNRDGASWDRPQMVRGMASVATKMPHARYQTIAIANRKLHYRVIPQTSSGGHGALFRNAVAAIFERKICVLKDSQGTVFKGRPIWV